MPVFVSGGGGEIRTHGGVTLGGFQVWQNPIIHNNSKQQTIIFSISCAILFINAFCYLLPLFETICAKFAPNSKCLLELSFWCFKRFYSSVNSFFYKYSHKIKHLNYAAISVRFEIICAEFITLQPPAVLTIC